MEQIIQYVLFGNVVIIAASLVAFVIERIAISLNLRSAYQLRLQLTVATLCTAALPLVLAPLMPLFASVFGFTGTDLVVSQYLKGNISLSATQISEVLSAKNSPLEYAFGSATVLAKVVIAALVLVAVLRVIYIGVSVLKIRKQIAESAVYYQSKKFTVCISTANIIPYTTRGIFRYYIVVPETLVSDPRAFRMTIGHEAQHIRQGDVNWEILLTLASPLFALNPVFWILAERIRKFREYSCDAVYLKKTGVNSREYCFLLLEQTKQATRYQLANENMTKIASVQLCGHSSIFNHESKSYLQNRIVAMSQGCSLMDNKFSKYLNLAPAIVLLIIIMFSVLLFAKPKDWSFDRLMLSTIANLERLDRINGLSVRPLR